MLQSMVSPRIGHNLVTEQQQHLIIKKKMIWQWINHHNIKRTAAAAKSLQLSPTLWDPIDSSPLDSVPGILQARILEWVAISFSNAWKWKVKGKLPSRVRLLATPWTTAYQAPPSLGFSRQECWSGVPLPSPRIYLMCLKIRNNFIIHLLFPKILIDL